MRNKIQLVCAVLVFLVCQNHLFFAAQNQTTAVIGFINYGDSGNEMNTMLTHSLISFFSKLPGTKIVPFISADKAARDKGFFNQKKVDSDLAIQIGQILGSRRVVCGSYKIDAAGQNVKIDIVALDTATADIIFKRHYEGKAGPSLLDTVDNIRKNAAGLLAGILRRDPNHAFAADLLAR